MKSLVRARALQGLDHYVRTLRGDPEVIYRRAKLAPDIRFAPDEWVSFPATIACYQFASQMLNEPGLGMKVAACFKPSELGMLLLCSSSAPDLATSIIDFARYLSIQNTGYQVALARSQDGGRLEISLSPHLRGRADQWMEGALLTARMLLDAATSDTVGLEGVMLRHQPLQATALYTERFGAPVLFGQECDALVISAEVLSRPAAARDADLHDLLTEHFDELIGGTTDDLIANVRALIEVLMPLGQATIVNVSAALDMHPRTLQRRLRKLEWSFVDLLDQQRRAMARRLVLEGRRSLTDIALYLGYSEQAAFNHAFERWFGSAPRRWAAQQHAVKKRTARWRSVVA